MKIQPAWNSEMRDIWWYMYAFARFLLNCTKKYTPAYLVDEMLRKFQASSKVSQFIV